jgi:hypothetical protein
VRAFPERSDNPAIRTAVFSAAPDSSIDQTRRGCGYVSHASEEIMLLIKRTLIISAQMPQIRQELS